MKKFWFVKLTPSDYVVIFLLPTSKHFYDQIVDFDSFCQHPGDGAQKEIMKKNGDRGTGSLWTRRENMLPFAYTQEMGVGIRHGILWHGETDCRDMRHTV